MYMLQFSSVITAGECLFALISGDEIFATLSFITTEDHPMAIFIFSRIYLISFMTIFIFAIANLFVALIMDSYETVKVTTSKHYVSVCHARRTFLTKVHFSELC